MVRLFLSIINDKLYRLVTSLKVTWTANKSSMLVKHKIILGQSSIHHMDFQTSKIV